jgi:arylsulfatase A-like enzyme
MDRPNIVLVNCDDLGYGDLGCYGSEQNDTPVLDRMAAEGIRFTDFYMASSICSPSRGAMMTGCYPRRIGFDSFDGQGVLFPGDPTGLHRDEITIADVLKERGYATKLVGKWHCGDQPEFLPTRHGFDSYYGLPYSNDMGRQNGSEFRPPLPLLRDEEVIQQQPDQAAITERYVEESVRFLRENRETPFFLYFAHMHVHLPLYAADRFQQISRNGPYGACVAAIDWAMGAILHELQRLGLEEKTLVIFTSDNGSTTRYEGSNAPLRSRKSTTWEGGIRVPCIARWPGKVPAGTVCGEVATAMDFFPTFAVLAGAEVPTDRTIDGKEIAPLLFGEPDAKSPHEAFYYYMQSNLEAVRVGDWKLHVAKRKDDLQELYNLAEDIGEENNLYDRHPEKVRELEAYLDRARADLGDGRTGAEGADRRPLGRVEDAKPLTEYDPEHPYIIAMYDLPEHG